MSGSVVEVAWKNGIDSVATKFGSGLTRRMTSLRPFATMPLTCCASPSLTRAAPTMSRPFGSVMNCAPGDASSLLATRSIA